MIDTKKFDNLKYSHLDLNSEIAKEIGYSHNLLFKGDLKNKNLKIDNQFSIITKNKEKKAISFLKEFINYENNTNLKIKGTFFLYKYKKKVNTDPFEAQNRVLQFLTAVRIYKNKKCDSKIYFPIKNSTKSEYYRPLIFSKDIIDNSYIDKNLVFHIHENWSLIESRNDLNKIKIIDYRLGKAKINKHNYYSKLYNAVKFFNYGYEKKWILLKTTLFFIALESLFSDSEKNEITYKVSLRTSFFLYPNNPIKRRRVFNFIREGYSIRSYFVHGSNVKNKINKTMKKLKEDDDNEDYLFDHHFINELEKITSMCLSKILLNTEAFTFFSKEKLSSKEQTIFFDKIISKK